MRSSAALVFFASFVATLSQPLALPAQQRPALFVGFQPNVALIDNQRDATLQGTGFQLSAYIGRPFASDFATLVELGVTRVAHRAYYPPTYFPPCPFPGCSGPSSLGDETALSLASGFQWYTAGTRRAAFTLTPGAVWFVQRPAGTPALVPMLGGRFELAWLLNRGLRVGLGAGVEWWGSSGTLPRWVVPLGLTLGIQ
jgi:hypothetical protein